MILWRQDNNASFTGAAKPYRGRFIGPANVVKHASWTPCPTEPENQRTRTYIYVGPAPINPFFAVPY